MDGMGLGLLGVQAARIEAESSRPWAPVVPADGDVDASASRVPGASRRARVARPRRALAAALHHLADAVAPDGAGHPAR